MNRLILAVDVSDLHPRPALDVAGPLWTVLGVALVLAIACIAAIVLLARRRRDRRPATVGVHAPASATKQWLARVDEVVRRYDAGELTADESYARLAALTRAFAAARSGRTLETSTLRELERRPDSDTPANWDALRLTIAALYPPEFADATTDDAARGADVHTAAGWVSDFMERWR